MIIGCVVLVDYEVIVDWVVVVGGDYFVVGVVGSEVYVVGVVG